MQMFLLVFLLFAAIPCCAQECFATPEAAAIGIVGPPVTTRSIDSGFRVQDVQADTVMHRVWVRVSRCGDASAPMILVPVRANLAGGAQSPQPAPFTPSAASANPSIVPPAANIVAAPIAVHAGDPVKAVFASSNVHMELDATADGQAAMGGNVEITLARRGDEPAHRMHGVLRAQGRVEVQP